MNTSIKYSTILILSGLFILLGIQQELLAQITDSTGVAEGIRGAPRSFKYDTRTIGMGDATVADPTDLTSININPATLSFVRNNNVIHVDMHQNWNNNLMLENFTLPAFRYNEHSVAVQFGFHHNGMNATNFLGTSPLPEPNLTMIQADFAYAYSIINSFSVGIINSISFAQNEIAQYWTFSPSLGMLYAPSESLSYGIALRGLGRSITYQLIGEDLTALGSQNLRETLELGASLQFPVDTDNTYLSVSLANEKRFGEAGVWYKAGLEVKVVQSVALRSGILFHPENNIYAPRFGIGFYADMLRLDYSISHSRSLYERFHQLGLTLQL